MDSGSTGKEITMEWWRKRIIVLNLSIGLFIFTKIYIDFLKWQSYFRSKMVASPSMHTGQKTQIHSAKSTACVALQVKVNEHAKLSALHGWHDNDPIKCWNPMSSSPPSMSNSYGMCFLASTHVLRRNSWIWRVDDYFLFALTTSAIAYSLFGSLLGQLLFIICQDWQFFLEIIN